MATMMKQLARLLSLPHDVTQSLENLGRQNAEEMRQIGAAIGAETKTLIAAAATIKDFPIETVERIETLLQSNELLRTQMDRFNAHAVALSNSLTEIKAAIAKSDQRIAYLEVERDRWRAHAEGLYRTVQGMESAAALKRKRR